ncbi:hypothetical protein Tcan_01161, partial [Toxocara canis]
MQSREMVDYICEVVCRFQGFKPKHCKIKPLNVFCMARVITETVQSQMISLILMKTLYETFNKNYWYEPNNKRQTDSNATTLIISGYQEKNATKLTISKRTMDAYCRHTPLSMTLNICKETVVRCLTNSNIYRISE